MDQLTEEMSIRAKKEAIKQCLKIMLAGPNSTPQARQEAERIVELSAHDADIVESVAKELGIDLDGFVRSFLG